MKWANRYNYIDTYRKRLTDSSSPIELYLDIQSYVNGVSTDVNLSDLMNVHNVKPMDEYLLIQRIHFSGFPLTERETVIVR